MPSLTSHLLNLDPKALKEATQHPFLEAAATSSLELDRLKAWLAQDRMYALAYTNFIGAMLAQIPMPISHDRESALEWRIADCMIDCLTNIRTELKLFESTAEAEGWLEEIAHEDLDVARETRAYQDMFAGATAQGRPLIVGLVVLWATEECYLRAWRYASSKMDQSLRPKEKDVMQRVFIPNWSSPEFEAFVRKIGALVNKAGKEIEEGSRYWKECENAMRQVMWLEKEFWPKMQEDEKKVVIVPQPTNGN